MNATEYKRFHESFMQNNHGSSAPHVFFCVFFTVQCSVYSSLRLRHHNTNRYLYEYIIIVLPLILAHTILSNYIYFLNFVIMTMLFYEFFQQYPNVKKHIGQHKSVRSKKIYSISIMRGLTYLITVCAILAVDFRDFPRHLAKTENYGYGLMDTGVGLFVLMSGLVHRDLRNHSIADIIKGNMKFISVLLILGIARYLAIKQLDYQEHVTEYGVHWNFFFTLAVCKFLSTVILYFNVNALLYNFIILLVHEFILYLGVQEWVFSDAERDTLLSANREGISSSLGYVSLYLFGAHVKNVLSSSAPIRVQLLNKISFNTNVPSLLILTSVFLWILLYISSTLRPTSRALANASYCLFLEASLVTVFTMLYYVESGLQDKKCTLREPNIIDSVNSNGLSFFLIANLLTGAINMSMRTLLVSSSVTFLILNAYMMLTLFFTVYLKKMGIKI